MLIIEFKNETYKHDNIWYYIKLSDNNEDLISYNVKVKKDILDKHIISWQLKSDAKVITDLDRINKHITPETWNSA